MNRNKLLTILFCIVIPLIGNAENKTDISTPYGSSQFYVWPELKDLEEFKVAFDFNFNDPNLDIAMRLYLSGQLFVIFEMGMRPCQHQPAGTLEIGIDIFLFVPRTSHE